MRLFQLILSYLPYRFRLFFLSYSLIYRKGGLISSLMFLLWFWSLHVFWFWKVSETLHSSRWSQKNVFPTGFWTSVTLHSKSGWGHGIPVLLSHRFLFLLLIFSHFPQLMAKWVVVILRGEQTSKSKWGLDAENWRRAEGKELNRMQWKAVSGHQTWVNQEAELIFWDCSLPP